jgi:hypothetical protein
VLESGKGRLSRVDLESGETETITKLPGFTSGLAFIGNYSIDLATGNIVGLSVSTALCKRSLTFR